MKKKIEIALQFQHDMSLIGQTRLINEVKNRSRLFKPNAPNRFGKVRSEQ